MYALNFCYLIHELMKLYCNHGGLPWHNFEANKYSKLKMGTVLILREVSENAVLADVHIIDFEASK